MMLFAAVRWLLALVLLAPAAQAGVPFEIDLEDKAGDVITPQGDPASYASADILSLSSRVADGRIEQRIVMADVPTAPEDTILLRNWFHNSSNGTFWTIDMEVRGSEDDPDDRFYPLMRRGDFYNATLLTDATFVLENTTWVFTFDASWVEDASCYDPGVFSRHVPTRRTGGTEGADALFLTRERRCLTASEPSPEIPALPVVGVPPRSASPAGEPPGSRTPTPGAAALVAIGALALAAWRRRA